MVKKNAFLIPEPARAADAPVGMKHGVNDDGAVVVIDLGRVIPDPTQPRKEFAAAELKRLADSIASRGQLQPIRVRWSEPDDRYVIVAGERRYRASVLAKRTSIAAVVCSADATPEEILEDQLVENCLRADLAPIEQAHAFRRLIDKNKWSLAVLGAKLNLDKAHLSRTMALLKLPEEVKAQVDAGAIAPATAYEVTKLPTPAAQTAMAQEVVTKKMTRVQTETAVRAAAPDSGRPSARKPGRPAGAISAAAAAAEVGTGFPEVPTGAKPFRLEVTPGVFVTVSWRGEPIMSALEALKAAVSALSSEQTA